FAHPALRDLAHAIAHADAVHLAPMSRVSREAPLVLSFAQQRLWFLAQFEGASQSYHMPFGLRLSGRLDRPALRQSLDHLLSRHEALRSTFPAEHGQPVVHLACADTGFALLEEDLQGTADPQRALDTLIAEEAQSPFDLATGPLIRGRLVRLAPEDHVLLITQHHIV